MSMYNADGYFQENFRNSYSVNNIAGEANDDGSFTVNLGGCDDLSELFTFDRRMELHRSDVPPGSKHN